MIRRPEFLLFVAIAVLACLSPVQNDTWWHLRSGQEMFRSHELLFTDTFSFTAHNQFFWNHSWLSQLLFYPVFRAGGLGLLTAACAAVIVAAWVVTWSMMSGAFADRLLLIGGALSCGMLTWSVRPQVFSILLLPVVLRLVSRDRWWPAALLFVLWANLHAGFVLGLLVAASSVPVAAIWDRDRFARRIAGVLACAAATLVTPLGLRNWTEIPASMARSRANSILEWQATPLTSEHLPFWLLAGVLLVAIGICWRRADSAETRVLLVAALVLLPLAVRTMRNIPAFAMLMAPAASRLMFPRQRKDSRPLVPIAVTAGFCVCAVSAVAVAWGVSWTRLGWHPMNSDAARAVASCRGPLFNTYTGGGPIIWFAPTQKVFVDSRQDPFPVEVVQAAGRIEHTGDYEAVFAQWRIHCAAVPPESPLVGRLSGAGWVKTFQDSQWAVLEAQP